MRAARVISAALTSICLVGVAKAEAQASVGATLGQSRQGEGVSDQPYLGPPFGGTSVAMLVMVDVPLAPRVTIGGEMSLAGTISGAQSQRAGLGASNDFVSEHRDNVFSGMVTFWTPDGKPVRAALAGGAGIAQRHTVRTGTTRSSFPPFTSTPFSDTLSDVVLAYSLGVDIVVRVTDHVGVLASGRVHRLGDDDRLPDGVVDRGVSSTIYRYGGGLQIRF
jgi:hypothetical protein